MYVYFCPACVPLTLLWIRENKKINSNLLIQFFFFKVIKDLCFTIYCLRSLERNIYNSFQTWKKKQFKEIKPKMMKKCKILPTTVWSHSATPPPPVAISKDIHLDKFHIENTEILDMPLATKVICKSELCCLTLKRREFAINFL